MVIPQRPLSPILDAETLRHLSRVAASFCPPKGKSHAPYELRASTASHAGRGPPGHKDRRASTDKRSRTCGIAGWRERVAPDLHDDPDAPRIERTGPSALAVQADGKRCVKADSTAPACLSQGCTSIRRSTDGVAPGSGPHSVSVALPATGKALPTASRSPSSVHQDPGRHTTGNKDRSGGPRW